MNETLQMSTKQQPRVLVLCHGNVCRSPLAAAVLSRELGAEAVRSGACKAYPSNKKTLPPAAKKVRDFAEQKLGIDLGEHRAKTVTPEDMDWATLILYMDDGNRERMGGFTTTENWEKVKCLAQYIGKDRLPDPAFTARGAMLEKLLTWVVLAAEACAKELKKKDPATAGSAVRQDDLGN